MFDAIDDEVSIVLMRQIVSLMEAAVGVGRHGRDIDGGDGGYRLNGREGFFGDGSISRATGAFPPIERPLLKLAPLEIGLALGKFENLGTKEGVVCFGCLVEELGPLGMEL